MRQGHVVGPGCVGGADDVRSAPEGVVDVTDGAVVLQVAALLVAEPEGQRVDALVVEGATGDGEARRRLDAARSRDGRGRRLVVGLNDSNFWSAGVESAVPPVAAVNAVAVTIQVAVVRDRGGIVQVRVVPVPAPASRSGCCGAGERRGESGAVILEVLAAVTVPDGHLNPTDGAGVDTCGASESGRRVVGDDPALDRAW